MGKHRPAPGKVSTSKTIGKVVAERLNEKTGSKLNPQNVHATIRPRDNPSHGR